MDKKPNDYNNYSKRPNRRCSLTNCKRLNIRVKPYMGSNVLCIADSNSKIQVSVDESTSKWYSVRVRQGGEVFTGYCLKEYIAIK